MIDSGRTQSVLFQDLARKPLTVRFEDERTSSDGGAILLKAADRRMGMIAAMAESFADQRDGARVKHDIEELLSQRIFGLACGYEDGNDAASIASDPVMKTLSGRDPLGQDLASQPSISRFERSATRKDLFRMSMALTQTVVRALRRGRKGWAKRITIDLDQTPAATYGAQQLTFFNGHYDTYCYIPLVAAISFAGEPDQYVVASVLRPGNAPDKRGAIALLSRLLPVLRRELSPGDPGHSAGRGILRPGKHRLRRERASGLRHRVPWQRRPRSRGGAPHARGAIPVGENRHHRAPVRADHLSGSVLVGRTTRHLQG
jgi:hypothetical protein